MSGSPREVTEARIKRTGYYTTPYTTRQRLYSMDKTCHSFCHARGFSFDLLLPPWEYICLQRTVADPI